MEDNSILFYYNALGDSKMLYVNKRGYTFGIICAKDVEIEAVKLALSKQFKCHLKNG